MRDPRGLKEGLRGALVSFSENPQQFSLPQRAARPDDKGRGGVEGGSRRGQGGVEEGSGRAKAASVGLATPLERPFSKKRRINNDRPWTIDKEHKTRSDTPWARGPANLRLVGKANSDWSTKR